MLCFIHPNENLYKEMFLLLLSCWELLCDPIIEHYSITQRALSGGHTGAACVIWEDILSSEPFEVSPSLAAGSLKNKSKQINKKNPTTKKQNKNKQVWKWNNPNSCRTSTPAAGCTDESLSHPFALETLGQDQLLTRCAYKKYVSLILSLHAIISNLFHGELQRGRTFLDN